MSRSEEVRVCEREGSVASREDQCAHILPRRTTRSHHLSSLGRCASVSSPVPAATQSSLVMRRWFTPIAKSELRLELVLRPCISLHMTKISLTWAAIQVLSGRRAAGMVIPFDLLRCFGWSIFSTAGAARVHIVRELERIVRLSEIFESASAFVPCFPTFCRVEADWVP